MLRHFDLPYGRGTLPLDLRTSRVRAVATSGLDDFTPEVGAAQIIEAAMRAPEASPTLRELARGKRDVTILISDHTRPVPSRHILPPMLREIREAGPGARITLLVATGCHRASAAGELREKLGDEIFDRERIVVHDCDDEANLVDLGVMPSGQRLRVNRLAAEADLLLAEGFIEPHFFAGYSGGRKSVLPGVAAREAVLGNHCAEFIDSPRARTGMLEGNPIHRDMIWAARRAGLRYIVNVVLNSRKEIVYAVAGDVEAAHLRGCAFLEARCAAAAPLSDIVVTTNGGHPLDQNIYQAVKGMTAAEPLVREGGVIVMLARAGDGHGGEHFFRQASSALSVDEQLAAFLARGRGETEPDQWQTQIFLRVLRRARVILVSDAPDDVVRAMRMLPARDPNQAMRMAEALLGDSEATVTVVPDGVSVITRAV